MCIEPVNIAGVVGKGTTTASDGRLCKRPPCRHRPSLGRLAFKGCRDRHCTQLSIADRAMPGGSHKCLGSAAMVQSVSAWRGRAGRRRAPCSDRRWRQCRLAVRRRCQRTVEKLGATLRGRKRRAVLQAIGIAIAADDIRHLGARAGRRRELKSICSARPGDRHRLGRGTLDDSARATKRFVGWCAPSCAICK